MVQLCLQENKQTTLSIENTLFSGIPYKRKAFLKLKDKTVYLIFFLYFPLPHSVLPLCCDKHRVYYDTGKDLKTKY